METGSSPFEGALWGTARREERICAIVRPTLNALSPDVRAWVESDRTLPRLLRISRSKRSESQRRTVDGHRARAFASQAVISISMRSSGRKRRFTSTVVEAGNGPSP